MKLNNNALTPIIGLVLIIMIVVSTMGFILFWGIPYIEDNKAKIQSRAVRSEFDSINTIIDDLIKIGDNASSYANVENNVDFGSFEINRIGDRIVTLYSYDPNYGFNVENLGQRNNQQFLVEMDSEALNDVTVYWLNDTCFLAGTSVLMSDGSYKSIEDVVVGDFVKSFDVDSGELVDCCVSHVFCHYPWEMGDFYLVINDHLCVTPNHLFFSDGVWVPAGCLDVGDSLFCYGEEYFVYSVERVFDRVVTYDLSVEWCHNFFVSVDGDDVDVLVHNVGPPFPPDDIEVVNRTEGILYTGYPYKIELLNANYDNGANPQLKVNNSGTVYDWIDIPDDGCFTLSPSAYPASSFRLSCNLRGYRMSRPGHLFPRIRSDPPSSLFHRPWPECV